MTPEEPESAPSAPQRSGGDSLGERLRRTYAPPSDAHLRPRGMLDKEIERLRHLYDQERAWGKRSANITKRMLEGLLERQEAMRPRCSNCGEVVNYGSEHCRGADERNVWWICESAPASADEAKA